MNEQAPSNINGLLGNGPYIFRLMRTGDGGSAPLALTMNEQAPFNDAGAWETAVEYTCAMCGVTIRYYVKADKVFFEQNCGCDWSKLPGQPEPSSIPVRPFVWPN